MMNAAMLEKDQVALVYLIDGKTSTSLLIVRD